jgi:uncharacterized protein YbjT (DUF2867 family)
MVITVTGSTGTIGSELVRLLSDAGKPTRAVFRNPRKIDELPNVAWIQADLRNVDQLEPTIAGTTRLFLLSDNTPGFGKLQIDVLQVAERVGVQHVVKLSALGASDHSKSSIAREHWEVEQALQRSGLSWTMLRPHSFMQNWLNGVAETVRTQNTIYSPIGEARVPFIDTRDIAAAAAGVLLNPQSHAGHKYVLTGGEAVGFGDVANALSLALDRPIRYQAISFDEARAQLEAESIPRETVEATLAIMKYQSEGGPTSKVSDELARILDRPPRTIVDFARDYAQHFR